MKRPSFDSLPLSKEHPPFSAWGLYGPDDQLGTLNLLTPEVVTEAAKEIRAGVRVGLDAPVNYLARPPHDRQPLKHIVLHKAPRAVHDDLIDLNTQISSQWDGFRHFGYQDLKLFYNGATVEELSGTEGSIKLGLHAWCEQGIVGRGVLLDYLHWAESEGKTYEKLGSYAITVDDLKAVAKAQNLVFKPGDILIVRTGFHAGYDTMTHEEKIAWSHGHPMQHVGVETSIDMARWLWESQFSAVTGDAPAFERMPKSSRGLQDLYLHEVLLSGWAMPIGEMWSLEQLSEHCLKSGRYSFFLTSVPLNIPGAVGSPSNAVAIF